MANVTQIELLSPARNLACGMAAVDHGADAVYVGPPQFGARSAASNSVDDIRRLADYAHVFGVKVYATVNTLLHDEELAETERMIWQLYRAGVDALIVQDMGILSLHLPPIPLHASTQMDNRDADKVRFLHQAGFRQVVLARELSLSQIATIHRQVPDARLEVFVHGALCVSYSGQCYVSQACFGRSANRGECAQFCRLPFDMVDADGRIMVRQKHLLSLKDLNQSDRLEALLDAGATSLKIEGRLKDVAYVKNVTAAYRRRLDAIFRYRKEYARASYGREQFSFVPQLNKSFSRGFTHYFLDGRTDDIFSFNTPKALGEEVGMVKEVRGNSFTVAGIASFANGDGLCYLNEQGQLCGFRVNRVENNRLFPARMPNIKPRTVLYRNQDQAFDKQMQSQSAERRIGLQVQLSENAFGYTLTLTDERNVHVSVAMPCPKEMARSNQLEQWRTQLGKWGGTPFHVSKLEILVPDNRFIPMSRLAALRRDAMNSLCSAYRMRHRMEYGTMPQTNHPFTQSSLTYLGNVMNQGARGFYAAHGVQGIQPAYELQPPSGVPVMFCRHCLRYSMGWCRKHQAGGEPSPYREPYYLVAANGRRFLLEFDCRQCVMKVYAVKA